MAAEPTPLVGWISIPPSVSHPTVSGSTVGLGSPSILGNVNDSSPHFLIGLFNTFQRPFAAALKHPRTPTNTSLDYPSAETDHMSKRTRTNGITDKVNLFVNALPGHTSHSQAFNTPDGLPRTLLFVGSQERLVLKNLKVWNPSACSIPLQVIPFDNKGQLKEAFNIRVDSNYFGQDDSNWPIGVFLCVFKLEE
ncbi:hypothetical protein QVD17_19879 [Tagetes erecta]|uniref:Uncharacterized protein n=1 Tax=Tagetes erecta TaxID=13708 RepID=A0AAD8NXC6_TARER|nr:hypothetical protein QVD17_19879 [Tagetes erecta]